MHIADQCGQHRCRQGLAKHQKEREVSWPESTGSATGSVGN